MLEMTLLNKWLLQAFALNIGESIYLPCINKPDQAEKYNYFITQRKAMVAIDPEKAETIKVYKMYKDRKHWVILEKLASTTLIAFKKIPGQAKAERLVLNISLQKDRQVKAMLEDGMSFEEIKEIVTELTEEEFNRIAGE
jgi:hypothetical protein